MTTPNAAEYRTPVQRKAAEAVQMCKCHFCGAAEGEECHVRPAGKPLKFPHQRRMRAYHHRCKSHTDGLDQRSPVGSAGQDRTEGRPVDTTPTIYGAAIDVIAEGVLRDDAHREMSELMDVLRPKHLTAIEILACVAIFRAAKERLDAQQRPPAPVLKLCVSGRTR
jgi:hypothetical protein